MQSSKRKLNKPNIRKKVLRQYENSGKRQVDGSAERKRGRDVHGGRRRGAERLRRNSDNFSNIAQYFAIEKAYTQGDRLLIKAIRS